MALRSDPFEEDFIVVPGDGLRSWLTREIARSKGICANLRFLSPERAVWMLINPTDGKDGEIAGNPFSKECLAWKIRGALPSLLASEDEDLRPIREYLTETEPLKTIQFCWQIATAFDGYLNYRPGLMDGWARGVSCSNQDETWQSLVWQAICDEFPPTLSKLCNQDSFVSGLPSRLWLFGLSHLPPIHLEVFKAYALKGDLRYLLLQPSDGYWEDVLSQKNRMKELSKASETGREELTEAALYLDLGPRLLGGLGKTGQVFIGELGDANPIDSPCAFSEPKGDTLLKDLQRRFLELQTDEAAKKRPLLKNDDQSIRVHSCHGPVRELEALREFLLSLFDGNRSNLRPEDVLVLTPSIKDYAPLVPAVFGNSEDPRQRIPYGVCDREWRNESRVMDTFYSLLEFADGRASARDTMELIDRPSMRDRFDLDDDEVELVRWWIDRCAVAWGYDGKHKEELELPPSEENTWSHGLGRMLLGFCMDAREERTFGGVLPFDEIEGQMGETLAKLVEILRLLEELHQEVRIHRTPREWKAILEKRCVDTFFLDDENTHADLAEIRKSLQFLEDETSEESVPESLASIRHHLLLTVNEKAGFSRHLSHGVTFASMRSARCVPARAICLMGLNGRQFPGRDTRPSFDVTRNNPRATDRDSTGEDRLLVLENILCAREILYLSYQGQSNKDNQEIPPSVVIHEILEELENLRDFGKNDEGKTRKAEEALTTVHPLQAFGRKYFTGQVETLTTGDEDQDLKKVRPYSYSKANLESAKALTRAPRPLPPFSTELLSPPDEEFRHVSLNDLARFWKTPCEHFLRRRIGMDVWEQNDLLRDREMLEPGSLEKYQLRIRLTKLLQSGDEHSGQTKVEKAKETLRKEGLLPPAEPGEALFHEVLVEAEDFLESLIDYSSIEKLPPHRFAEKIGLFELAGEVEPVHGDTLLATRPALTKVKDRMDGWIRHLAANAFGPQSGTTNTLVAGTEKKFAFSPSSRNDAQETLGRLLELYWEGLCRPLPFFPETSSKWLETVLANQESTEESGKRKDPLDAARLKWQGSEHALGEGRSFANRLCFPQDPVEEPEFAELAEEILGKLMEQERIVE